MIFIEFYAHKCPRQKYHISKNAVDYFAANLLLPKERFTEQYTKLKEIYKDKQLARRLAQDFIIPVNIVEERIKQLGLN